MASVQIRLISGPEVRSLLSYETVYAVCEQVFRWEGQNEMLLAAGNALWLDEQHDNMFNAMGAAIPALGTAGCKWFNMFTRQQPGLPSMFGHAILLNSMATGAPFALVEGTSITNIRTAAGHGTVAAKWLARPDSQTVALVGCGSQAGFGLRGLSRRFPGLRQVRVYGHDLDHVKAFVGRMEQEMPQLTYEVCSSAAQAVRQADIVMSATTAKEPLVMADDLRPGTTVIGLYSFNDLDPAIAQRADKWFLGCRQTDRHSILEHPMLKRRGIELQESWAAGDMGDVICGRTSGRDSEEQIIVYTHMGMAGFDVALAKTVYELAVQKNIGQEFALEQPIGRLL